MKNYDLKINGQSYAVEIDEQQSSSTSVHVTLNGNVYDVEVAGAPVAETPVQSVAPKAAAKAPQSAPKAAAPQAGGTRIKSPLPGTVLAVKVAVGATVAAGQTIAVIEAMKMENNIAAERGGTVKEVLVSQGATVMEGDTLIVIG
ncbi:MAG: biotin/lipoyl-containing protein [Tidjanibacter sp.]|nr:biotin/lipoyl-containing protein [Tidjanibacter sp.]